MSELVFRVKCKLINGKFVSKKNVDKIFAVSSELCTHVHGYGIDPNTYYEKWAIRKEPQGYIFREVTHNCGINGHHKTMRRLIMATCGSYPRIKVIFQNDTQA